jgi:hypothetical protein
MPQEAGEQRQQQYHAVMEVDWLGLLLLLVHAAARHSRQVFAWKSAQVRWCEKLSSPVQVAGPLADFQRPPAHATQGPVPEGPVKPASHPTTRSGCKERKLQLQQANKGSNLLRIRTTSAPATQTRS